MKQCPNCGHTANDDDAFCLMCGTPISSVLAVNKLETTETIKPENQAVVDAKVPTASHPDMQSIKMPAPPEPDTLAVEVSMPEPAAAVMQQPIKNNFTFLNTGIGIIITAFMLAAAVFLVTQNLYMFELDAALNQFGIFALLSIAVVLTVRAKGPDLSIGAVLLMAPVFMAVLFLSTESLLVSILLTVGVCGVFGLLNGVLITFLKIPSIILTLLTGLIVKGVFYLVLYGIASVSNILSRGFTVGLPLLLIIVAVVFAAAFLFVLFTPLGTPTFKRDDKSKLTYMFAYAASAFIASGTGILLLGGNFGEAVLSVDTEVFIIFAFSLLISSRAFDNKYAPVPLSLIPVVIWVLMQYVIIPYLFNTHDTSVVQLIIGGTLALIMLVIAFACRYVKKDSKYSTDSNISLMQ